MSSSAGNGGATAAEPEPDLLDDEVARRKMREAKVYKRGVDKAPGNYDGFDPTNVADIKSLIPKRRKVTAINPMGYFARRGDLRMMRWLCANGAGTRDLDVTELASAQLEDDETARQKMRDAKVYERGVDNIFNEFSGFDPNNVGDVKSDACRADTIYMAPELLSVFLRAAAIKSMGYFARIGDLPMMRWLYVHGADTRDDDVAICFPMYVAARFGHLEVCKWLFQHGAAKDIKRRTSSGCSPLFSAFGTYEEGVTKWLILNGVLCKDDDSGDLDVEIVKRDLGGEGWSDMTAQGRRKDILKWANDLHRARTSFLLFLSGALPSFNPDAEPRS